jgi:soluble lytic murein transglycosylase-like protein
MKNTNTLMQKLYKPMNSIAVSGFLLGSLFHMPVLPHLSLQNIAKTAGAVAEATLLTNPVSTPLTDLFFGSYAKTAEASEIVTKQMEFVSSRKAYAASLAVVEKNADTIRTTADAKGVPQDVALGVAFLENGGSEHAVSPAGAAGAFQLMRGTAKNLGLTVTKAVDERMIPEKNIEAGISYLKANYERFGDWGLATWGYHAGEGNVAHALRIYAKAHDGINIPMPSKGGWEPYKDYVLSHGITVHTLLSDPTVQQFTSKLDDDSDGYPYKVMATAALFHENS